MMIRVKAEVAEFWSNQPTNQPSALFLFVFN